MTYLAPRSQSLKHILRRGFRMDLVLSVIIVSILVLWLVAAPLITVHDPYSLNVNNTNQPPSLEYWMGTDDYGRDVYTRVVYGTRYSLSMGLVVTALSIIIGLVLGGTAGYFGGRLDEIIMRFTDMVMGFPALLFAMVIAAVLGSGLVNAALATAAVWWPSYVRLLRGQVLSVKNELFIEVAQSIGARDVRIIWKHILPNSWGPIIVRSTMDLGRAVIFTSTLSFIGLGAQPPIPEWGTMLAEARWVFLSDWWYVTFPGLAIFCTVFAFGLLGDILEEVLRPF